MATRTANAQELEGRRSRGTRSFRCRVCRGIHPLRKCNRFLRLSVEKRLRAVLINKYCSNCLAHQHSGQSCRSKDKCRKCGQDHHTLLHMREQGSSSTRRSRSSTQPNASQQHRSPASRQGRSRQQRRSPPRSRSSSSARSATPRSHSPTPSTHPKQATGPPPTLAALLQHKSTNVLPTAVVRLHAGDRSFVLQALFDPCAAVSSISASLAAQLQLPALHVGEDRVCKATVASKVNADLSFEVLLKIVEGLHIHTPVRPLGDSVRARFANLTLANDNFHRPSTISLVLGADAANHVVTEGFMPSQNGLPMAQSTIFGWMVSGSCSC